MRLYTEHTEHYLHALAVAISKDPASFEGWSVLRIYRKPEEKSAQSSQLAQSAQPTISAINNTKNILEKTRQSNANCDADIILCPNEELLIISCEMKEKSLRDLAGNIVAKLAAENVVMENAAIKNITTENTTTKNTTTENTAAKSSLPEKSNQTIFASSAYELSVYDCFKQWREVRAMMLINTQGSPAEPFAILESSDWGETESLSAVFEEAKKIRKARQPQHVMLVEDDALTRRIVASSLKDRFAVITAHDAHEAVANYLLFAPDIVFLDIGLPDASGFAALKQIIAIDPDAYVVMFSGNSYLDNVVKALTCGASGFVAKPFRQEKLHYYISGSALHYHKSA